MAVARDHLCRERVRLQGEALACESLDVGLELRVRADRAGELADAVRLQRPQQARARPVELERPADELPAERGRLGMDAVRAADADGVPVPLSLNDDSTSRRPPSWICSDSAVSTTSEDVSPWCTQRPAGPSCSATASTKAATSWSVARSISATRSGDGATARSRIEATSSAGIAPTSAQASSAASSTSSQRASLLSSDQILAMAGRA
jgi:hypothetical protein